MECASTTSEPTEIDYLTAPVDRVVSSSTTMSRNERTATYVTRRRYHLEKTTRTGKVVSRRRRAVTVAIRIVRIVIIGSAPVTATGSGGQRGCGTTGIQCGVVA